MPIGMEMALKLMLPGESCELTCGPKYGYEGCCSKAPEGVLPESTLLFSIELLEFEKEGHPQAMDAEQIITWATRQKDAANALYKASRTSYAIQKYDKVRVLHRV